MPIRRVAAVAAIALAAGVLATPAHGKKKLPLTIVNCNQAINQSIRVANDLVNCAGNGLVVAAPNIKIDLDGHTFDGTDAAGSAGIRNAGHDGVKVVNGNITDFEEGVYFSAADDFKIKNITAIRNTERGIRLSQGNNGLVKNNLLTRNDDGLLAQATSGLDVIGNELLLNTTDGLFLQGDPAANIEGNTASSNGDDGFDIQQSPGVVARSNDLVNNGDYGTYLLTSNNAKVRDNRFRSNADGLRVESNSNTARIRDNIFAFNGGDGFQLLSQGNVAKDNLVRGNNTGLFMSNDNNRLLYNRVVSNTINGIHINTTDGNVLKKNVTAHNGIHGIHSVGPNVTLTQNRSNRNGFEGGDDDFGAGINIPLGSTSSGNKAKNNDDPNECEAADVDCHVP